MSIEDRCQSKNCKPNTKPIKIPGVKTPATIKTKTKKPRPTLPEDSPFLHKSEGTCYCQGCIADF